MTIAPILASDTAEALGWFVAIPVYLGLLGLGSVVLNAKWGRRRWWGFLLALLPTLVGGLSLLFLILSGGALAVFYVIAGFPLICGLCSLFLWMQERPV